MTMMRWAQARRERRLGPHRRLRPDPARGVGDGLEIEHQVFGTAVAGHDPTITERVGRPARADPSGTNGLHDLDDYFGVRTPDPARK
jgi:hypothetical protein